MWIAFTLHHGLELSKPLLYLSIYFKPHRPEYDRLLDLVRTAGDWEVWSDFFLEGVESTAANAIQTAKRLVALLQEDQARVQTLGRTASSASRLLQALHQRPILTLQEVRRRTQLSFPPAAKSMNQLVTQNIAKELTGQRRYRMFTYRRYLANFDEGTRPQ